MSESNKIKTKDISVEVLGKVDLPHERPKPKDIKCSYGKAECVNHHICWIMGQCVKEHPAIKKAKLQRIFNKYVSSKHFLFIMEPLVPLKVPFSKRKREYKNDNL